MFLDPWNIKFGKRPPIDFYPIVKPFLFAFDPETIHKITIRMLGMGLGPKTMPESDPILHTSLFGLDFPNPVGLGAGLDKQAEVMDEFMRFGFGAMEVGTVTPLPQSGNPLPRMFRISEAKALINRFGFNSVGLDVFTDRLKAWREKPNRTRNPVGVNIGKNKDSKNDVEDYLTCLEKVSPYCDFITVNISSPNTPGLRELQDRERLTQLLTKVLKARQKHAPKLPILVKIAPDLTGEQQEDIAAVTLSLMNKNGGVQGIIIGNTTISRSSNIPREIAKEAGGLSGPPLYGLSTRLLTNMYRLIKGKIPLIGCGGISNGQDAYAKIRAGASLVQIYTALVFEGPMVVQRINRELAALLRRDGFDSVKAAVGADHT